MNKSEILRYLQTNSVGRKITDIVIHCSATKADQIVTMEDIDSWHKARGFSKQKLSGRYCGYHFVIQQDGTFLVGRFLSEVGAHVEGQNSKSIGICYIGGLDNVGKPKDTRTKEQKDSLVYLLTQLVSILPDAKIKGHRDYSPDKNGNGIIEPFEWLKACPCFNAIEEYKHI